MAQESNVIILQKILKKHSTSLEDLIDQPKLFCMVFKETFELMNQELLSSPEDELPTPTLVVIKNDLFHFTKILLQCPYIENTKLQNPTHRIDYFYSLSTLNTIIDAARTEIMAAISIKNNSSTIRSKRIQNSRNKILDAIDIMNDFEGKRI